MRLDLEEVAESLSSGRTLTAANMTNENVYDANVKKAIDSCLDEICRKLADLKASARKLEEVAEKIKFAEEEGCFKYGTLVKKQTARGWSLIPIEEV